MEIKEAQRIIDRYLPEIKSGNLSILDIGCREGTFLQLARQYNNNVFGIEHRKKYWDELAQQGIPYIVSNIADLPCPLANNRAYDIVVCLHSFSQVEVSKWDKYIEDFSRLAKSTIMVLANRGEQYDQYSSLLHSWSNNNWYLDVHSDTIHIWRSVSSRGGSNKIHQGVRGFVIGGGESIKILQKQGLDIEHLIRNEITIGTNKSYLLGKSTYHVAMDAPYFKSDEANLIGLPNLYVSDMIGFEYPNLKVLKRLTGKGYNIISESFEEGIYYGKSSGYIALNLANILGLNPIYLLGIDLVGKHFHAGYGPKADTKLPKDHNNIEREFRKGIAELGRRDVKVISLSNVSSLNDVISYNPYILEEYGWRQNGSAA